MSTKEKSDQLRLFASILGATGVGLGAFGAHGLKNKLAVGNKLDSWKTAVMYQLLHTVAILSLSTTRKYVTAGRCMALGTALFSGSIYCLCLDIGPKKLLGPTTPLGGLLLITGWVMVGMAKSE